MLSDTLLLIVAVALLAFFVIRQPAQTFKAIGMVLGVFFGAVFAVIAVLTGIDLGGRD